jgi:hypothetical protein
MAGLTILVAVPAVRPALGKSPLLTAKRRRAEDETGQLFLRGLDMLERG